MFKERFRKILAIVVVIAEVVSANGMTTFAASVSEVVKAASEEASKDKKDLTSYYYEHSETRTMSYSSENGVEEMSAESRTVSYANDGSTTAISHETKSMSYTNDGSASSGNLLYDESENNGANENLLYEPNVDTAVSNVGEANAAVSNTNGIDVANETTLSANVNDSTKMLYSNVSSNVDVDAKDVSPRMGRVD